jgi:hypothetical protein
MQGIRGVCIDNPGQAAGTYKRALSLGNGVILVVTGDSMHAIARIAKALNPSASKATIGMTHGGPCPSSAQSPFFLSCPVVLLAPHLLPTCNWCHFIWPPPLGTCTLVRASSFMFLPLPLPVPSLATFILLAHLPCLAHVSPARFPCAV